jgi:hypothetical protein
MQIALVIGLTLLSMAAFGALLAMPRWLGRNLGEERIWRLRCRLINEILVAETLPKNHVAVRQLVERINLVLDRDTHFTMLHIWLVDRSLHKVDQKKLDQLKSGWVWAPMNGLSETQQKHLSKYRKAFEAVMVCSLLISSWSGVLLIAYAVVVYALPAAFRVAQYALRPASIRGIPAQMQMAVDMARVKARIGRVAAFPSRIKAAFDWIAIETSLGQSTVEWLQDVIVSKSPTSARQEIAFEASLRAGEHYSSLAASVHE